MPSQNYLERPCQYIKSSDRNEPMRRIIICLQAVPFIYVFGIIVLGLEHL